MGAFTAFMDLSLGIANPALGLVADHAGLRTVFLATTVTVMAAAVVAARLLRAKGKRPLGGRDTTYTYYDRAPSREPSRRAS